MKSTAKLMCALICATSVSSYTQNESIYEECSYIFDQFPQIHIPEVQHQITNMSIQRDTLQLEDDSIWTVSSYDAPKLLYWNDKDTFLITQNNRWFTSYQYRLINQTNGSSAEINLASESLYKQDCPLTIKSIDQNNFLVELSDDTMWLIAQNGARTFDSWSLGDAVIIGYNSNGDEIHNILLINYSLNHSLCAQRL